MNKHAKIAVFD